MSPWLGSSTCTAISFRHEPSEAMLRLLAFPMEVCRQSDCYCVSQCLILWSGKKLGEFYWSLVNSVCMFKIVSIMQKNETGLLRGIWVKSHAIMLTIHKILGFVLQKKLPGNFGPPRLILAMMGKIPYRYIVGKSVILSYLSINSNRTLSLTSQWPLWLWALVPCRMLYLIT